MTDILKTFGRGLRTLSINFAITLLIILFLVVIMGPFVATVETNNLNWLWFYIPHGLLAIYSLGVERPDEDDRGA